MSLVHCSLVGHGGSWPLASDVSELRRSQSLFSPAHASIIELNSSGQRIHSRGIARGHHSTPNSRLRSLLNAVSKEVAEAYKSNNPTSYNASWGFTRPKQVTTPTTGGLFIPAQHPEQHIRAQRTKTRAAHMAEEPQRSEAQANGHATAVATEPAKPLPPGLVLGPDGKPYVGPGARHRSLQQLTAA